MKVNVRKTLQLNEIQKRRIVHQYTDVKDVPEEGKVCPWKELMRLVISKMKKNQMLDDSIPPWHFSVISVKMKWNMKSEDEADSMSWRPYRSMKALCFLGRGPILVGDEDLKVKKKKDCLSHLRS